MSADAAARLREALGDEQWQQQRDVARAFDPAGILDTGKVFASTRR